MRGGRAGGLGTTTRKRMTPELLEGDFLQVLFKYWPTTARHHGTILQPVRENGHKAHLWPARTISSAPHLQQSSFISNIMRVWSCAGRRK